MLYALLLALGGCATTQPSSTVIKTLHEFDERAPFSNVLVIGVAGEFPTRVRFEQQLVAEFSVDEPIATAFYTIVGRRAHLTRKVLNEAVRARGFDAIILTRIKGQDQANLVPNRPTGHGFELYLYDYEELNIPAPIDIGSTVSFVVEVYDARARKKVWAIESLLFDTATVESVISDQVACGSSFSPDSLQPVPRLPGLRSQCQPT
jgi:hypothetical protein